MDFSCDKIVCINLEKRTDKKAIFTKMMEDIQVPFEFFNAIYDPENSSRGCFRSHAQVISDAYSEGVTRLMVFEDDALYSNRLSKSDIDKIAHFLNNEDWDIFFLGSYPNIWENTIQSQKYSNIYKGSFLSAGAYILNTHAISLYRNLVWGGNTQVIDKDVFMKNNNAYAYLPRIYTQHLIPNDITYGNSKSSSSYVKMREVMNRIGIEYALNINIKLWKAMLYLMIFEMLTVVIMIYLCKYKRWRFHI